MRTDQEIRQHYINAKIIEATRQLKTLAACPQCNQSPPSNNVTGKRQTAAMDVHLIYCPHPYHSTQYDDGSGLMMSAGLPNHPSFDKNWIAEMQYSTYLYGLRMGL
jgi:hypothetical protein